MKRAIGAKIWALSVNVLREAIRDRLLLILTVSGAVVMLFSLVLGKMTVGGQERVVQNMGFWVLGIWGLLAVLYLGSNIIKQELQRQTIYLLLSRPVNRPTFLMGKFLGMLFVLLFTFGLLAVVWLALMQITKIPLTPQHFWALAFIFGEWIVLAAFSLFFASFTSPLLHNFFLVGITFLGHWSNDLRIYAANADDLWLQKLLKTLYFILPNLEALNFRDAALLQGNISPGLLMEGAVVLFGWMGCALIAANLIFVRRKLL